MSPRTRRAYRTRTFLEDAVAWLTLLTLAGAATIFWHYWAYRPVLASVPETGVADPLILALAYDRVVEDVDIRHVDRGLLREQLLALRSAGFQAIGLETLARFYRGELDALPARSLVLTFDHGYLSTADAVDPVLRELEWPAAMFVMTERQERRDPFFLYWPRLRRMAASGLWEIGSHGRLGHTPIRVDDEGGEGPFFVRRAWLPSENRAESGAEFAARALRDQQEARGTLEEEVGRPVLAYAPPLKDVAVASLDPEVASAHEEALATFHTLAFVDDLFGVNDRLSDPHHLKRMRVAPRWSADTLGKRVAMALGAAPEGAGELLPWRWVAGVGEARLDEDSLVVEGPVRADVWRAASQLSDEWALEAQVRIDSGQLWIVQQSSDLSEEWRWGGDGRASHLQRRRPASQVETLASFPEARVEPGRPHRLKIVRRGAGVWVEWDGRPVSDRPAHLPDMSRGTVGLVVWGDGEPARLTVRDLRFSEVDYRAWPMPGRPSAEQVQSAIRESPGLAALSPLWLQAGRNGLREQPLDRDLLAILARRYGWEILPTLRLSPDGGSEVRAARLGEALALVAEQGFAGMRIDATGLPPEARQEIESWAHSQQTRWRRFRLLVEPAGRRLVGDTARPAPGEPRKGAAS
ncbi:MAG TPA: polysaccharide deacetylase family protein [Vicinamibacteria bacterium]|nr:polysaccharide deacetylase family protein [Vicinamibacteria bacterium]